MRFARIRKHPSFHKRKPASQKVTPVLIAGISDGPLNLVGTEASGTSVHMARSTIDNRLDALDVGLPGTVGTSVGVGNLNAEGHALATIITLSHSLHLLSPG
jgi:hypothetical protein